MMCDPILTLDDEPLNKGALVTLRSGGVQMTVQNIWFESEGFEWMVYCSYWSEVRGKIDGEKFPSTSLKLVAPQ